MNRLGAVLAGMSLAGCASLTPVGTGNLTSGRMSLQVEASAARPAQNLTVAFELQGDSEDGELRLISPLGIQLASARWSPREAALTTPAGSARFASLDELSRQALGESLPLAALPSWLAGRPWPGAVHTLQATGFEQLGWQVGLERWADGFVLARRDAPPVVSLRVRLDGAGK